VTAVIAATVTALAAVFVALITAFYNRIRRDLEACERERKQLKQVLQLVVSSIVGLLQPEQKVALLQAVDAALNDESA
jgi:predicted type IV restriction endonuclease